MTRSSGRATWAIAILVVGTALSTLLPGRAPQPAGGLRLAVLNGPGSDRTQRAVAPLAGYLASALHGSVVVEIADADRLRAHPDQFELALLPAELTEAWPSAAVLAWANCCRPSGSRCRPFVLFPRDHPWYEQHQPRLICGDAVTWAGGRGAAEYFQARGFRFPDAFGSVAYGADPYDHGEAIHALVHGAFDVAAVSERDVRIATAEGTLDLSRFAAIPAGEARQGFALVATAGLSTPLRRVVRESVLNLDLYSFDPQNQRVALVVAALQQLGIDGFAPDVILPSLHP